MSRIMTFIALTVSAYVSLTYFALFLRVIIGVFSDGGGLLSTLTYAVTEPILAPIRRVLDKIEALQNVPLDLSVVVAMALFIVIRIFLPSAYTFL